ncbi:electron transport complex subunit RsxG [Stutzerimonas zhaodongensis]|uniref:electron transport complex subunit RsxG n=1 Tax=Stutzerimonas zhaodongensis TaxID=1176257 RepID=UPI0021041742|nr:electron transport complex subunit RsxG [Stutzerimonas zhaodongensis]MCQ2029087.1 electron transport complex subunit RsxG [Stutzerimonas zhaodongensis]
MILPELIRSMLKNSLVLGLFAVVTVGAVTVLRQFTAERIEASERAAQLRALNEILPSGSYDNQLLDNSLEVQDPLLGTRQPLPAYIALKEGNPVAVILQAVAPDGYSGAIHLLIGVHADGRVAGVRVVAHRETPGLGDKIELSKSPWIRTFENRSLNNPEASGWAVKKDRGDFDQFAGATITPRAVVGAVHRALQYFDAHKQELLTASTAPITADQALESEVEPDEVTTHSRAGAAATRDDMQADDPQPEQEGQIQ